MGRVFLFGLSTFFIVVGLVSQQPWLWIIGTGVVIICILYTIFINKKFK